MIELNLTGVAYCCKEIGRIMATVRSGKIINIASIAGTRAAPTMASYGAAKAGVINLTRSLAVDWAKYNINVNCIAPGIINTPLTQRTLATWSTPEQLNERVPL